MQGGGFAANGESISYLPMKLRWNWRDSGWRTCNTHRPSVTQSMVATMTAAENADIRKTTFAAAISRMLGLDLHSWELLMLWALAFAALAAGAVVVTTAAVVATQRAEGEKSKSELEQYKAESATKIAEANSASETAKKEAAQAANEAAAANERAAVLEKQTAELELALEQQRIARLQLEERHSALAKHQQRRTLNADQRETLIRVLSQFPKQRVVVDCLMGDDDGKDYAEEFLLIFTAAGWSVPTSGVNQVVLGGPTPIGIQVTISKSLTDKQMLFKAADILATTLGQLGIIPKPTEIWGSPEIPEGMINFRVGAKPPPNGK